MTFVIDPRRGDAEDDASSTKQRSLLSLAGSLLAEISLPKLIVAWVLLIGAPALLFEASRFRFELELAGIVANHADLAFGKSARRFGRDFQRKLHLHALGALKLHHDRIQDRIERLHRTNHVDFDRAIEPVRLA